MVLSVWRCLLEVLVGLLALNGKLLAERDFIPFSLQDKTPLPTHWPEGDLLGMLLSKIYFLLVGTALNIIKLFRIFFQTILVTLVLEHRSDFMNYCSIMKLILKNSSK